MKILAEYNGERVYLVNIRENGTCDIIKTTYNEKTEQDTGELLLVNKKSLKIVDSDFLIDSLQEHLRQIAERGTDKKADELTKEEKALVKRITASADYQNPHKKIIV